MATRDIILIIYKAFCPSNPYLNKLNITLKSNKLILSLKTKYYIKQSFILNFCPIILNYYSKEDLQDLFFYINKSKRDTTDAFYPKYLIYNL